MEALHHFHRVTVESGYANTDLGAMMGRVTQLAFEVRTMLRRNQRSFPN